MCVPEKRGQFGRNWDDAVPEMLCAACDVDDDDDEPCNWVLAIETAHDENVCDADVNP